MTDQRFYRRPEVIDEISLDRHCVIEANAGTGKTFTIEHLVIEILLNSQARLDQILAVTFTEKAAAEMRARIRDRIEKTLRGDSGDSGAQGSKVALDARAVEQLESALFAFDRAPIHTIHSFCHRMLTELAFQTGTRFAVEVSDSRAMFHEAFRAELRERFALDEWMRRMLEEWLADERRTADRLELLLFDAHRRRYLESGAPARNVAALEDLFATFDAARIARELPPAARKKIGANLDAIGDAIARSKRDPWRLRIELRPEDLNKAATALARIGKLPDHVRRAHRAISLAQFAVGLDPCVADAFLPAVSDRLERLKRERGAIDFDDMPKWLWSALEGSQGAALAQVLRDRFRIALVDEFQDTDDLQWRIFKRVFVEGGNNRLIVIGDPKQAIYAFRGADVFAYLEATLELRERHDARCVRLTRNFRSTAAMIDAINLIFAQSPSPAIFTAGDIRYQHPVTCGRPEMLALQNGRAVKPLTIFSLPPGLKLTARRYRTALGREIAATLKRLLDGGNALEIVEQDRRQVRARDIFVLTRTLTESREIAAHLRAAGVPYAFYKQDGLFQTREAGHVLDVLRAVAEPHRRSNRLKAWSTPFFGVALRDLPALGDVPPSHPLMARLLEWKTLADEERFEDLFAAMLHQSGLAARELLTADTQRELTNYEHIFEILLERAFTDARDLRDLARMLAGWIDGNNLPPGENPNVQRLDSERDAVQIMTVHKSKGLEADVIVLFGGYARGPQTDRVTVFHRDGERLVVVGSEARSAAKPQTDAETNAEDERLLYVGLTRAKAKLYLAMFPEGAARMDLNGCYKRLNDRIRALATGEGEYRARFDALAEIVPIGPSRTSGSGDEGAANAIGSWAPPEALTQPDGERRLDGTRAEIIARHRPLSILSYTSLRRRAELRDETDHLLSKYDPEPAAAEAAAGEELARGRAVGIFLHEAIERLDMGQLRQARDLESWKQSPEVRALLDGAARRHQVQREAWIERGAEIVFNALRSPIALGDRVAEALAQCDAIREMEFTFPIPSRAHPMLNARSDGRWKIDRGLMVGFVDFVFRFHDRVYFADWKSDYLDSYEPAAIAAHVSDRYLTQARIYTVGITRLLRIRDRQEYEQRFGGLVYIFVRGVKPAGDGRTGVYFHRPSWDEVVAYERDLIASAGV